MSDLLLQDGTGLLLQDGTSLLLQISQPSPPEVSGPDGITVEAGETAEFIVLVISSVGTVSFQWHETTAGLLAGEITDTLSFTAALEDDGKSYFCLVTDDIGTTQSDTAALGIFTGAVVEFIVVARGTFPLTYQWYTDGDVLIDGATEAAYAAAYSLGTVGDGFYCIITNAGGTAQTDTVFILEG